MYKDLIERLRACKIERDLGNEAADALAAQAAEIERLRDLFKIDGELHAQHIKDLTTRHEMRINKYLDALNSERTRAAAQADFERRILSTLEHD